MIINHWIHLPSLHWNGEVGFHWIANDRHSNRPVHHSTMGGAHSNLSQLDWMEWIKYWIYVQLDYTDTDTILLYIKLYITYFIYLTYLHLHEIYLCLYWYWYTDIWKLYMMLPQPLIFITGSTPTLLLQVKEPSGQKACHVISELGVVPSRWQRTCLSHWWKMGQMLQEMCRKLKTPIQQCSIKFCLGSF